MANDGINRLTSGMFRSLNFIIRLLMASSKNSMLDKYNFRSDGDLHGEQASPISIFVDQIRVAALLVLITQP